MPTKSTEQQLREALGERYQPADDGVIAAYVEALALSERLETKANERFTSAVASQLVATLRLRVRCLQLLGLAGFHLEGERSADDVGPDDF